eukprot:614914-Prymnesium_polylepis.2
MAGAAGGGTTADGSMAHKGGHNATNRADDTQRGVISVLCCFNKVPVPLSPLFPTRQPPPSPLFPTRQPTLSSLFPTHQPPPSPLFPTHQLPPSPLFPKPLQPPPPSPLFPTTRQLPPLHLLLLLSSRRHASPLSS